MTRCLFVIIIKCGFLPRPSPTDREQKTVEPFLRRRMVPPLLFYWETRDEAVFPIVSKSATENHHQDTSR